MQKLFNIRKFKIIYYTYYICTRNTHTIHVLYIICVTHEITHITDISPHVCCLFYVN